MAVVLFHSAEAWLLMVSICGRLLLLGAVQLRFIWDFLDVTVSMTPGGSVGVLHLFSPSSGWIRLSRVESPLVRGFTRADQS